MSEPTNDAPGEVAEKRVRKPRVAKARSPEQPEIALPPAPTAVTAAPPAAPVSVPVTAPPAPAPVASPAAAAPAADAAPHDAAGTQGQQGSGQFAQGGQEGGQQHDGGQRNNRRERFKNRRDRQRERYREGGMPDDGGGNNEAFVPRANPQVPEGFPTYSLGDLKRMPAHKLLEIADQLQISEGVARARKQDIIFAILKVLTRHGEGVQADGVLEILPDGFGFLRAA
ncbi:MAG TPA: Rho termination factor N-terminal domain-containing protein, partial [Thermomonas sp.]|nr:Rho termination factor N-terminal domain-containing protein [Thermomonas sp.]